jgi:hypothetical protein
MACDDAVLAQTGTPRVYARCLARIAEKSFVRRQMALAQAAVDRVRQLTLRVTRILDGDRPRSTRLWKPAIPMVAAIALLCAVSTSRTPDLVSLRDDQQAAAASRLTSALDLRGGSIDPIVNRGPQAMAGKNGAALMNLVKFNAANTAAQGPLKARPANLKSQSGHSLFVSAHYVPATHRVSENKGSEHSANAEPPSHSERAALRPTSFSAKDNDREASEGETQQYGVVLLLVTSERINSTGSISWQVNMWEVRLPAPASHPTKPIPRKT